MIIHEHDPNKIKSLIHNNNHVILDFWAEWCDPCIELGKILKKVDEEFNGDLSIIKINVEEITDPDAIVDTLLPDGCNVEDFPVARGFENGAIPMLFFYKNGTVFDQVLHKDTGIEGCVIGYIPYKTLSKYMKRITNHT